VQCRVCHNDEGLREYIVREMMFGTKELFPYVQCPVCGCLQIKSIPSDMSRYYGAGYYSREREAVPRIVQYLFHQRDRYIFSGRGLIGRLGYLTFGKAFANHSLNSLSKLNPGADTRILDVGCGDGKVLKMLRQMGFDRVHGIDPYNDKDVVYDRKLTIRKAALHETDGQWDVIMLHHVFEHLPDPQTTLSDIRRRLAPDGTCVVRIPVVSSHAWERYGVNWVQIDAPRHLFLHSMSSMTRLASEAGFDVADVVFDSNSFQFWGSELYTMDIPLKDAQAVVFKLFSLKTLRGFAKQANALNAEGRGDQAIFYLKNARHSRA